jgi:hypothetical protein
MQKYNFPLVCTVCTVLQALAFPQLAGAQSAGDSELRQISDQDSDNGVDRDPQDADTYDVFYNRLASDGQWFYDDNYGYVFQPTAASSGSWRPYSDGHWVWTDRGWTWVSNENFGWATYHYGRWIRVSGAGWVWIPGNEWAPAWVSWRQTDDNDYCGWAPLPPEATVSANVGVSSWVDNYYDIGPAAFTFVRFNDFWRPSYRGYYLPPEQNLTIINRTQNITNITYNNNVINNNGPQFQRVSQITAAQGHPLQAYQINYAAQAQRNAAYKTAVQGNQLNVIAPPQKLNAIAHTQPPAAKQLGNAEIQRGWQNVLPAQKQQLQQTFAKQSPVPTSLPPKPGAPPKPQFVAGKAGNPQNVGKPTAEKEVQAQKAQQETVQHQQQQAEAAHAQPERQQQAQAQKAQQETAQHQQQQAEAAHAQPERQQQAQAQKAHQETVQRQQQQAEAAHAQPEHQQPPQKAAAEKKTEERKKEVEKATPQNGQ